MGDLCASDLERLGRCGMGKKASKEENAMCKACAKAVLEANQRAPETAPEPINLALVPVAPRRAAKDAPPVRKWKVEKKWVQHAR